MTTRCYLCGAGIRSAWLYGKPVTVDNLPHADGNLTISRHHGAWRAERAVQQPYARQAAVYRAHRCVKPVTA